MSVTTKVCKIHNEELDSQGHCTVCTIIAKAGSWPQIWERHLKEPEQRSILVRTAILSYETGKVLAAYHRLEKSCDPAEFAGYRAELHGELSDVITQIRLLCLRNNWDINQMYTKDTAHGFDHPQQYINHMTEDASEILKRGVYCHLSGDNIYLGQMRMFVKDLLLLFDEVCLFFSFDPTEVSEFGKTRIRQSSTKEVLTGNPRDFK